MFFLLGYLDREGFDETMYSRVKMTPEASEFIELDSPWLPQDAISIILSQMH